MKLLSIALLAGSLAYAQTDIGGRNFKGRLNATLAPSTAPFTTGLLSARASACTQGDVYFSTDASAGSNLSLCTTTGAPGVWTVVSSSGGVAWGGITGTYTNQTDLVSALAAKLTAASNLSDLASASTARTNLGLGTAAVSAASAFEVPLTFAARLNRSVNTIDLATGIVTPGSCGDTTHSCSLTVDTYGRVTGATNNTIAAGAGDVVGPSSATDNAIARYDSTTGKLLQNSLATVDDSGNFSTPGGVTAVSFTGTGTTPTAFSFLAGSGNIPALPSNSAGFAAPTSGGTSYLLKLAPTVTAGLLQAAAPGTVDGVNESAVTYTTAPTISSFANANHDHSGSTNGGLIGTIYRRKTGCIVIGANNAAAVIVDADLGPQSRQYFINSAQTLVEIEVAGDAGTPNIIIGRSRAGTIVNLTSSALATAASGGIACSNTGGTTGLDGATTCGATLQNTSLNAGDWITLVSGTAGGTAKEMTACFTTTVN